MFTSANFHLVLDQSFKSPKQNTLKLVSTLHKVNKTDIEIMFAIIIFDYSEVFKLDMKVSASSFISTGMLH